MVENPENILALIDSLIKSMSSYHKLLTGDREARAFYFVNGQPKTKFLEKDKVAMMLITLKELKQEWKKEIIAVNERNELMTNNPAEDWSNLTEGTYWQVTDEIMKISTINPQKYKSSVMLPVSLFLDIANCAISVAETEGFVKTSIILNLMRSQIIKQSHYKKFPRVAIVFTLKILVKQRILAIESEPYKKSLTRYCLVGNREDIASILYSG